MPLCARIEPPVDVIPAFLKHLSRFFAPARREVAAVGAWERMGVLKERYPQKEAYAQVVRDCLAAEGVDAAGGSGALVRLRARSRSEVGSGARGGQARGTPAGRRSGERSRSRSRGSRALGVGTCDRLSSSASGPETTQTTRIAAGDAPTLSPTFSQQEPRQTQTAGASTTPGSPPGTCPFDAGKSQCLGLGARATELELCEDPSSSVAPSPEPPRRPAAGDGRRSASRLCFHYSPRAPLKGISDSDEGSEGSSSRSSSCDSGDEWIGDWGDEYDEDAGEGFSGGETPH